MPTLSPIRRAPVVPLLALALLLLAFCARAEAQGATVLGWGKDSSGAVDGSSVEGGCACLQAPTPVPNVAGVTQVTTNVQHTLALRGDGTVLGWGANRLGRLGGLEAATPVVAPAQIPGLSNVVAIATGELDTIALLADGRVAEMGENAFGQLGIGTTTGPERCEGEVPCSRAPVIVPGLENIVAVAAGDGFSLALGADGRVFSWGVDTAGEAGDAAAAAQGGCECVSAPTPVPGVSGAMAIAAADEAAYALLGDGTVKAWGRDHGGELGDGKGSASACECQGPITVPGVVGANELAAGSAGAIVGFPGGGPLLAWGDTPQLAEGPPTPAPGCEGCIPPSPVRGGLPAPLALAEGEGHALALRADGTVEAWGGNNSGELGDGGGAREAPALVAGVAGVSGIAAGFRQSFALIGPAQALKVSLAGTGTGRVGGPTGILCPRSCAGRYPQGQVEVLRAEATGSEPFAGWSGACTGTGPCQAKLEGDEAVSATFGRPKGTRIAKARISSPGRRASFSLEAPGALTGFQCELVRPRPPAHHGRRRAAHRRPRFAPCAASVAYKHLGPGTYTFKARALDSVGPDPKAATRRFSIEPRRKRHH